MDYRLLKLVWQLPPEFAQSLITCDLLLKRSIMTIYHVVLLKFKQDSAPADIESVRARLHGLPSQIPAISGIKAGHKIKHPMDRDFDEGIILVFKDEDALQTYLPHPAHREYQEYSSPHVQDKLIFDIYAEE